MTYDQTTLSPAYCLRFTMILLTGVAALMLASAAQAQNLDHQRHLVRHNPPHPTTDSKGRMQSSRTGRVLALPVEADAFTFAVFGDRTGGPAIGVRVLADAVHDTNLFEPDLVMTVGDLVQGYNETPKWMEQMREYHDIMNQLLCPWFPVAGNHDVYWRGPADQKPDGEHDANYEKYFAPLWYAFEHKNCVFIALYSDEGNPETGEKNFRKPECQKMSPAQFEWLKQTLADHRDAEHIFCFLHHPRWITSGHGGYGDDWSRVHDLLKEAGNVSAVFAGHIHRMHYQKSDGIEYVTLATVGGGQSGTIPEIGYLHHYNLVTVRKDQIAIASIPVGEAMDVREIDYQMQEECLALSRQDVQVAGQLALSDNGEVNAPLTLKYQNTASRPIEVNLSAPTGDSRWVLEPDHFHQVVLPGETCEVPVQAYRYPDSLDDAFQPLAINVQVDYLAEGARYSIPQRVTPLEVQFPPSLLSHTSSTPGMLLCDGKDDCVRIDTEQLPVPDGPFTIECWMWPRSYTKRVGLITKTQGCEYGIFVNNGRPHFSVHLNGKYQSVKARPGALATETWHHVAGVFDGAELRVYVDGELHEKRAASGKRTIKPQIPFMIGADPTGNGTGMSFFDGAIDEVRISKVARYDGERIEPQREFEPDAETVFLTHADRTLGPWVFSVTSEGGTPRYGWREGGIRVGDVERVLDEGR